MRGVEYLTAHAQDAFHRPVEKDGGAQRAIIGMVHSALSNRPGNTTRCGTRKRPAPLAVPGGRPSCVFNACSCLPPRPVVVAVVVVGAYNAVAAASHRQAAGPASSDAPRESRRNKRDRRPPRNQQQKRVGADSEGR
ncbi:hypothetical protein HPB47_008584 [Ixodes persulcatus]|uniref:Uncharacterized protein n=1 Tax=Ixodes persulcatus TaxID=34615 RepID=A0AC60P4L3_IXOPE|nr:hypothetical protein HPB47_008584 [Ixodes persulcatus]